jgi:hypothetical protein
MNEFYRRALELLGGRQQSYQSVFAGSAMHLVMTDLAKFSGAFLSDPDGMTHDDLMKMHGRRQMFFRIYNNLKLSPPELEEIARPALIAAAARLNRGESNE